ncbi:hypothetical protein GYMLUDRAFT_181686, partial [Collybiopsis luxurians FD-317 M1]
YRHIWPFEHARREASGRDESKPTEEYDDYVNASYVQLLCTSRRYIATQGPLEATFTDFWVLVYQQNVPVIVMLTREIEGAMVKCGPYWKGEVFGLLRLKLIKTEGNRKDPADAIIKWTFLLSHTGYPDIPARKVVQFQYLEWPDMNVPNDPRGVLNLIHQVDQAHAMGKKQSPVLLHCSAGVGRTGGFIAVDAVLDGIRRELQKKKSVLQSAGISTRAEPMEVDRQEEKAVEDGEVCFAIGWDFDTS